jgi:hypothetical protein
MPYRVSEQEVAMFYLGIMRVIVDRWHDIVPEACQQAVLDELTWTGANKTYAQYAKTAEIASKVLAHVAKTLRELENHTHEWTEFLGEEYCKHCGIRKSIVWKGV